MKETNNITNQEIEEIRNFTLQVLVEEYTSNTDELLIQESLNNYGIRTSNGSGHIEIEGKGIFTFEALGLNDFFNQLRAKSKDDLLKLVEQSKSLNQNGKYRNIQNEADGNEFDELFHKMFDQEEHNRRLDMKARGIDYERYQEVFGFEKFNQFKHRLNVSLRTTDEQMKTEEQEQKDSKNVPTQISKLVQNEDVIETKPANNQEILLSEFEKLRQEAEEQDLEEDLEL